MDALENSMPFLEAIKNNQIIEYISKNGHSIPLPLKIAKETAQLWYRRAHEIAQERFPYSNFFSREVVSKERYAFDIETLAWQTLELFPKNPSLCTSSLLLMNRLASYFIYAKERFSVAEKKLIRVKEVIESYCTRNDSLSSMCEDLGKVDCQLPSAHATSLNLLGRIWAFTAGLPYSNQRAPGMALLRQSIAIRTYIDAHKELDDSIDSPSVGNTHIFKRTLGMAYLENKQFQEAEKIFLAQAPVNDGPNQIFTVKCLIRLYHRQAQSTQEKTAKLRAYSQAMQWAHKLTSSMEKASAVFRKVHLYAILGDLYLDKDNPSVDLALAEKYFTLGKSCCEKESYSLALRIHEGLALLKRPQLAHELRSQMLQSINTEYLSELGDDDIRRLFAYEQLGDLHSEKGDDLFAMGLYTNGLKLAEHNFRETDQARLWQKMAALDRKPSLAHDRYFSLISEYRQRIKYARQQTAANMGIRSIEESYLAVAKEYREILSAMFSDILRDLNLTKVSFALVAAGSLAQTLVTPFSDIDLAILLPEEETEKARDNALMVGRLLALRLIALGETPLNYFKPSFPIDVNFQTNQCLPGLMLDGPCLRQKPPFTMLTPQQMASSLQECSRFSLSKSRIVAIGGNVSLVDTYNNALMNLYGGQPAMRNAISQKHLEWDLSRWSLNCSQGPHPGLYNIKYNFYRLLSANLGALGWNYWLTAETPWQMISALKERGICNEAMLTKIESLLNNIATIRLNTYLKAGWQCEWFSIDPNDSSFYYVPRDKVVEMYCELKLFGTQLLKGIIEKSDSLVPRPEDANSRLAIEGEVEIALGDFDRAKSILLRAIKSDPSQSSALYQLGRLFTLQGQNEAAEYYLKEGIKHCEDATQRIDLWQALGANALTAGKPAAALEYLRQSLSEGAIDKPLHYAQSQALLGIAYIALDKRVLGLKHIQEGFILAEKFCGREEVHPVLKEHFYTSALALWALGHLHEAKDKTTQVLAHESYLRTARPGQLSERYSFLSGIERALGNYQEADKLNNQAQHLNPSCHPPLSPWLKILLLSPKTPPESNDHIGCQEAMLTAMSPITPTSKAKNCISMAFKALQSQQLTLAVASLQDAFLTYLASQQNISAAMSEYLTELRNGFLTISHPSPSASHTWPTVSRL